MATKASCPSHNIFVINTLGSVCVYLLYIFIPTKAMCATPIPNQYVILSLVCLCVFECMCAKLNCQVLLISQMLSNETFRLCTPTVPLAHNSISWPPVWRYCSIAPDILSSFLYRMCQQKGRTRDAVDCLTLVCVGERC